MPKAAPEDILIRITVCNRGPETATLHVLPTLWFRNIWSWGGDSPRPVLWQATLSDAGGAIAASHPQLGERLFCYEGAAEFLFTENETNTERWCASPTGSRTSRTGSTAISSGAFTTR